MDGTQDVVIVGGGIAGLAAAHWLQLNNPACACTLIDRAERLGGKILTDRIGGFVIEGGPDSFLSSKPQGLQYCREIGIEGELVGSLPEHRRTFVVRDGELFQMPEGLSGLVPARLEPILESPLFSDEGKARFAREPEIPPVPAGADESLAHFMERRFGEEVYSRLIEPLMSGIYAGDGAELSLGATFPQLRALELEYGSVVRGMDARKSVSDARTPRPGFVTPRTGMVEIVEATSSRLNSIRVLLGTGARRVRRGPSEFQIETTEGTTICAQGVILATPAYVSAEILSDIDPPLAGALAAIPHASTATISLGFRSSDVPSPLDGYGYIVPRREGTPVLACTWVSSKYPHRVPDDEVLIRGFVGRRGQEEALQSSDHELIGLMREELRQRLGITASPVIERVYRWPLGMPQYSMGHRERLTTIEQRLDQHPGLALAGNAYRGVGIPDCIASGESAATHVSRALTPTSAT
jgi:protoporphyrinogen/coproporphyrinogen III oxidase